jgi:hypothetical protein
VRPAEELRVRIDRELLVVALADELLQGEATAAVHVDVERRRAAGIREQAAVEEIRGHAAAGRERAGDADRENGERQEREVDELPSHERTPLSS